MYTKEDVMRLIADLGAMKSEKRDPAEDVRRDGGIRLDAQGREVPREVPRSAGDPKAPERYIGNRDIVVVDTRPNLHNVDFSAVEIGEPHLFGLALDAYDPVSGEVFMVCRPHRREYGEQEIFLTPTQLAGAVATLRANRLHNERAGLVPARPLTDEQEAAKAAQVETARKQQAEAAQRENDRVASETAAHEREAQNIRQRETGEVRA